MGVHVLHDNDEGKACLFDSTSGHVLGRIFRDEDNRQLAANEIAEMFLYWYRTRGAYRDVRQDPHLADVQERFIMEVLPHAPTECCDDCAAEPYEDHSRTCEKENPVDWREQAAPQAVSS